MKDRPDPERCCEILTELLVLLPEKQGLSLKEASQRTHIDLYKRRSKGNMPLTLSLCKYGEALQVDADWILRFACLINKKKLSKEHAVTILANWVDYKHRFNNAISIVLSELAEEFGRENVSNLLTKVSHI